MRRKAPIVSVNIPAHNAAAFIAQALDSVLAQTFTDWECLVVDDASTDGTADAVRPYLQRDPRFRFHRVDPEQRRPFPASRNLALGMSTGQWIAPLDADDLWAPAKLARQLAAVEAHGAAVLSYHPMRVVRGGQVLKVSPAPPPDRHFLGLLLGENQIIQSSVLMRRKVVQELGGYDPALHWCEDWDLCVRLTLRHGAGRVVLVPEILGTYCLHETNTSANHAGMNDCECRLVRQHARVSLWQLHRPLLALQVWERGLDRQTYRYSQMGAWPQARRRALAWACVRPWRRWRWVQMFQVGWKGVPLDRSHPGLPRPAPLE